MEKSKQETKSPEVPGYKRFGGAKLVPPPAPIAQINEEQGFPVFLGVGIALSIAALITVFVLAFFSHKTKVPAPQDLTVVSTESANATPGVSPAASASASPAISPTASASHSGSPAASSAPTH